MIFWIVAALLTFAVVLSLLWPLISASEESADRADFGLQVYRDQLSELEREAQTGRLSEAEVAAARAEVERRMLAVGRERAASGPEEPLARRRDRRLAAAFAVIFVIPGGSLLTYAILGEPGRSDLPYASRAAERAQVAHTESGGGQPAPSEQGMNEMVLRLEQRLAQNPDDLEGWALLGRTFMLQSEYGRASDALARALSLSGGDPQLRAAWAESLVLAAEGEVTERAEDGFRAVVAARPGEPRARFYLGLAHSQRGQVKEALDWWLALEADTPPDAPWAQMLAQQIIDVAAQDASVDLGALRAAARANRPPRPASPPVAGGPGTPGHPPVASATPPSPTAPSAGEAPRGPSQADIAAAQQMSAGDRMEMIKGMVEGLAARLEENPNDVQGWQRLARSYGVLGRPDDQKAALKRLTEIAPDRTDFLMEYARVLFPRGTPEDQMTAEFKAVIEKVLTLEPDLPEAWFYGGMIAAADGDAEKARTLWTRLLERMGPQAPARPMIQRRLDALGG